MDTILYLVFRRMRRPLMTLIVAYAIAVLGMVLIPGEDADGNVWHMGFFQALYFVSYMATTIGFGELPHEFTDIQRLWVLFCIYATVISWIYAIGTLIQLVQTPSFQQAIAEKSFTRHIKSRTEPFYLVCGYGETGSELVTSLIDHNKHAVVLDIDPDRINELELANLSEHVPSLCADARRPLHLNEAGLKHRMCRGVVAITNSNEANLKIAITSKLLRPDLKVICRSDSDDVGKNMKSFGTDTVIDPFDTFAETLATALHAPCSHLLYRWLTGMANERPGEPVYPPSEGKWIVCGFGRFGKAIYKRLQTESVDITVVELFPEKTGVPDGKFVQGRGTEADTLCAADIKNAVGLVAGTDDDANNLSIIATALELNPDLFTIARKNARDNDELFNALDINMVMNPGNIIANKIRAQLASPMLYDFLRLTLAHKDDWACQLVSRITGTMDNVVPDVWEVAIDEEQAHAVMLMFEQNHSVTIGQLIKSRYDREERLNLIVLAIENENGRNLLPAENLELQPGDLLLLCGRLGMRHSLDWNLQNLNVIEYLVLGRVKQRNLITRWFRGADDRA